MERSDKKSSKYSLHLRGEKMETQKWHTITANLGFCLNKKIHTEELQKKICFWDNDPVLEGVGSFSCLIVN